MRPTGAYSGQTGRLAKAIQESDAIVIGAGAGLSTSAGLTYSGARFERYFGDFIEKYHFPDMYTAGFYPYSTPEEHWAYWSRYIYWNRYERPVGAPYHRLRELVRDRDYFVITTNVDHCFQPASFDKERLFYTQGDYGLWQCSQPCTQHTYDNEQTVRRMVAEQRNMRIPTELLPHCPVCGKPMTMNLRADDTFVEDAGWHAAAGRYADFLRRCSGARVLYLELGVGGNTPGIIKYPFWKRTHENPQATYACVNLTEAYAPQKLGAQALCIQSDIGRVLEDLQKQAGA